MMEQEHPNPQLLERFMRTEIGALERRQIVRHLLAGCPRCVSVTRRLWNLGEPLCGDGSAERQRGAAQPPAVDWR